jgi:dolichyl-phosphate-mannose-protein mannosyltransferase
MTAIGRSVPIDGEGRPRQDQPRSRLSGVPGLSRIASGWRSLSLVLLLSLLVRIPFIPLFAYLPDGSLDESDWKGWMQALHEHGFLNIFRDSDTNYVGYHWVLWPLSLVYGWFGGTYGHGNGGALHVLVKTPIIGFDMLLICVVYAATALIAAPGEARDAATVTERATKLALIAALVIALQPGAIYDSAIWPNTDSLATACMLAAIVLAFQGRVGIAGAVWAFGFLMKPQPIVILPLLLLIAFRRDGLRAILRAGLAGAAVALVMTGPWLLHGDLIRILKVYRLLFHDRAPVLSWSAWNLWRFWDATVAPAADDRAVLFLTYRTIGLGMCAVAASIALGYAWIRSDLRGLLVAGAYLVFAFYILPVTTHERYLFPFLGLLLPVAMVERRWFWIYVPVSVLFFFNLVVAAPPVKSWDGTHIHDPLFLAGAALNVLLFLIYTAVLAPTAWHALFNVKGTIVRRLSVAPA